MFYQTRYPSSVILHPLLTQTFFYIPGNDLALLDDTVKRRLNIYHRYQENSYIRQSDIDRIHFDLEKTEEDITEYVCHSFQKYSSSPKLKKAVKDFFQNLNWYLQKPLCIYRPCSQYPDKILNILGPVLSLYGV